MFEKLSNFFNKMTKPEVKELASKDAAKERLHLVLMQDRANVSVDFLELMKQEIIDVIKKYIVVDENAIDVRLTNQENEDGTNGAPSLYANIPILNIKNDVKAEKIKDGTLTYENSELEKKSTKEDKTENNQEIKTEKTNEEANEEVTQDNTETVNTNVIELGAPEVTAEGKEELALDNMNSSTENEIEFEKVDQILDFADDDEEDDDVTFDDLLKKAEEEEAIENDENALEKKNNSAKGINQKPIRSNKNTKQKKR